MMNSNKQRLDQPHPQASANIFSRFSYLWTKPIFQTGFYRDLETTDLYVPLDEHLSSQLGDVFSQSWKEELKRGSPSLFRVIFKCFKWPIFINGLFTLLLDCIVRISQPIFLGMFIAYFVPHQTEITRNEFLLYAFGLVTCSLVYIIVSHAIALELLHMGLKIKIGCCSLIYRKTLKLSKTALNKTDVGYVVNLMSNDVVRLEMFVSLMNYLVIGPIQTFLITYFIWREIGIVSLVGVLFLLAIVPFQIWLGAKSGNYRMKAANLSDERMQKMSEVLSGIKIIKMHAWEMAFCRLVEKIRRKEMKWIGGTSYIQATIVSFSLIVTRFALFSSILCYAVLGNEITAQKVFVVASFYGLLKQSMTVYFPRAITLLADFLVSIKRISRFLLYDETTKPITDIIYKPYEKVMRQTKISKILDEEEETFLPLHTGDNVKEIKLKINNNVNKNEVSFADMDNTQGSEVDEKFSKSFDFYPDTVLEHSICMDAVFVKWVPTSSEFALSNINLSIKHGSFTAIVGPVGAGKTSLLNTILKELSIHSGSLDTFGVISYASQDPWLFNNTIKNNILFGSKMDRTRYNRVLQQCALDHDLSHLPHGDRTLVEELGANLSGGQRTRINLARAVFRNSDIYLFDDPLSPVDAQVGHHLFENCFLDYLRGTTRLLVTHQMRYLNEVDNIIVLNDGCVVAEGTYEYLEKNSPHFKKLLTSETFNEKEPIPEGKKIEKEHPVSIGKRFSSFVSNSPIEPVPGDTKEEESRNSGSVDTYVYKAYLMASGSNFLVWSVLLAVLIAQIFISGSDFWISNWVNTEESFAFNCKNLSLNVGENDSAIINNPLSNENMIQETTTVLTLTTYFTSKVSMPIDLIENITDSIVNYDTQHNSSFVNISNNINVRVHSSSIIEKKFDCESFSRHWFIHTYTGIVISLVIMVLTTCYLFFWSAKQVSINLHSKMFNSVTRGTMRFFHVNPSGRILNRFSKDMSSVDVILPQTIMDVLTNILQVVGVFFITMIINFWMSIPILFSFGLFILLRIYYIPTSRSIFRLVGVTRSPGLSHLCASLHGIVTIRAFGNQRILEKEFDSLQNIHVSACYLSIATGRAFGFWLDSVCLLFIAIATWNFSITTDNTRGGNVGLVITQVIGLTTLLQYGMRMMSQMENEMISVERILDYIDIEHEPPLVHSKDGHLPTYWPQNGKIIFNNVWVRYSPTKIPAVCDVSFIIHAQEKIGIVGRTGAGKSTIINALFRLAFIEGDIEIDGVKTDKIGLHVLRKNISIIPQEPTLFSGSIRYNLDPFNEFADEILWNVLEKVQLKILISDLPSGLNSEVSQGGVNFSVGQRQLLCLARAIISKNRIIILDEATANIDQETDYVIQQTLSSQFSNCTIVTIAHRLQTVMGSDKILVMEAGRLVEFDHPFILLQDKHGYFTQMVNELGKTTKETFKNITKQAYEQAQARINIS